MRATAAHAHDDLPDGGPFRDGLGNRRLVVDPDTREVLEYLDLIPELGAQERAIRERVERLSNFRNVRFPRLHQVQSEKVGQTTTVSVVAEHAPGQRLSELLAYVDRHPTLVFDVNAVLQVAREVLAALAVLHDSRGVTHGALGLQRLVLSPQGRMGIVDYALGAALTKLQFPRTRLWRDFRIAMPPSAGIPRFDTRADVAGVAVALLALLIGRPINSGEFPNELRGLLESAVERLPNGTVRQLSSSLKAWFERALPVENRKPYATALDAQLGLDEALKKESSYSPSPGALKSFLQRYESSKPRAKDTRGSRGASPSSELNDSTSAAQTFEPVSLAKPASRASRRGRLTPDEESAEEVRIMEAELARLAREETTDASQPAPEPVLVEAKPPAGPSVDEAAVSVQVVEPVEAGVDLPPPAAKARSAEPAISIEQQIEAEIEVEIVSLGKELPKVDVAALADDSLSVVVAAADPLPPADFVVVARDVPAVVEPAVADEEITALEELLREYDAGGEQPIAASTAPEVANAAVEVSEPEWLLSPPPIDGQSVAEGNTDEVVQLQDDATLPLDFDATPVPDYVVRLFDAGWVTGDLVARSTPLARTDSYRLQMFAAAAPTSPAGALEAAGWIARRGDQGRAAALPERATPVVAALSTRQPSVVEQAVRASRSGRGVKPLRIVAVQAGEVPSQKAVASLPAEAQAVAASLVKVEESALFRAISDGSSASTPTVLRLVKPPKPSEVLAAESDPIATEPLPAEPEPVAMEPVAAEPDPVAVEPVAAEPLPAAIEPEPETLLAAARDATASLEAELERLLAQTDVETSVEASADSSAETRVEATPVDARHEEPVTLEALAPELELEVAPAVPQVLDIALRELDEQVVVAAEDAPAISLVEESPTSAEPSAESATPPSPAARKRSRTSRRRQRGAPPSVPPMVVPFVRPEAVAEPVAPAPIPVDETPGAAPAAAMATEPAVDSGVRTRSLPADPWKVEAEASKTPQVIPFTPRAVESHEQPAPPVAAAADMPIAEARPEAVPSVEPVPQPSATVRSISADRRTPEVVLEPAPVEDTARGWRINWRRTAAASLVVILLEGVAFATAYWLVKPSEMGTLLVETSRPGVDVLVDGRPSGRTPLTTELKPGRYTLELRIDGASKVIPVEISPGVQTTQQIKWPAANRLGRLRVTTTPPGARILVDGQYRGASPVVLDDIPAGSHAVVAESPSGIVRSKVDVGENELAELDLGIFSGWLTVFAPVEVRIFESGRLLGTSLDGKLLVPPGPHEIELVNTRLGYRETRTVEIEPGEHTALSVTGPSGTIVIDAPDGTEVTVDGQSAGTTPLEGIKAPIGTREVVLKHPALGQRRMTVTVRADAPARLSLLAPQ